jgi:hypothetical protein
MFLSSIVGVAVAALGVVAPATKVDKPIVVKVLVLNFDPILPSDGGKRLHEAVHWQDPRKLAAGYVSDLEEASKGFIKFKIVEWRDLDDVPVRVDGFKYTGETYRTAWFVTRKMEQPERMDYPKTLLDNGVIPLVNSRKIDEVWMFGAPGFGGFESCMAGPGAFFINGDTYDKVPSKRPFPIMGFSYERGVAEMVHDLCHRAECSVSHFYGGWDSDHPKTNWDRFSAWSKTPNSIAGVGTCHCPPNATGDYDYGDARTVLSTADDWLNYPNLTGATKPVSRDTWGVPDSKGQIDYQRTYLKWWFSHLPRATGVNPDGRENNWWKYIFEFEKYDANGKLIKKR